MVCVVDAYAKKYTLAYARTLAGKEGRNKFIRENEQKTTTREYGIYARETTAQLDESEGKKEANQISHCFRLVYIPQILLLFGSQNVNSNGTISIFRTTQFHLQIISISI